MPFRQILVALDRTPFADRVFERSLDLAQQTGAHLLLLHCVPDVNDVVVNQSLQPSGIAHPWPSTMMTAPNPGMTAAASQPLEQSHAQLARQWLMQHQQKAQTTGCPDVSFDVRSGQPGVVINEVAQATGADLIVVGRRDRSGIEKFLLGSVSKEVINNAPCEVLVVPQ